jgi:3-hydroxy-3-methylglutaryl CoA synthase
MNGIVAWGGYVPRRRIERARIAEAHAWMAPGLKGQARGERSYTDWDEDVVTMSVEAARHSLAGLDRSGISQLTIASTTAPFADLQASSIAAVALGLAPETKTTDVAGSQRAGVGMLSGALSDNREDVLVVASDRPRAKPASIQEMQYGAGAAAFVIGSKNVAAEFLGAASSVELFVDHFRAAGAAHDYYWEERWVRDEGYQKIGVAAVKRALEQAKLAPSSVDHFIFAAPGAGGAPAIAKKAGLRPEAVGDALDAKCGYAGTAHPLLMLAHILDTASPGEIIAVLGFGQGCEVVLLRTTPRIVDARPARSIQQQLDAGKADPAYLRFASFYGEINPDWGMREERDTKTALTEQYRSSRQVYGFVAGQCGSCGATQFPQLAYCIECQAPGSGFIQVQLAEQEASVLTYTADSLMYHPSPPLYIGFAQFDNGARLLMEFVDVDPANFDVGTRVTMRFRIKERDRARGYDRYFWKAAPAV